MFVRIYRKKRGLNPTGILAHKAKASGLASVSMLLEVEGHDNFAYQKKPKLVLKTITQILIFVNLALNVLLCLLDQYGFCCRMMILWKVVVAIVILFRGQMLK